jgi:two-component system, response regulator PdtaR
MTQIPTTDQPTILVAEDDALLRLFASELLLDNGYKVVLADNAAEALKVMEVPNDIRLLFTDIEMPPGIDGLELAREVHRRWPKVLFVITSGGVLPAKSEIADDGHFLQKPYRFKELLSEIAGILKEDDARALQ